MSETRKEAYALRQHMKNTVDRRSQPWHGTLRDEVDILAAALRAARIDELERLRDVRCERCAKSERVFRIGQTIDSEEISVEWLHGAYGCDAYWLQARLATLRSEGGE